MRETWVQSLGQEDPLEKEMATHSSNLAWRIPWMEEPGGLQSMRLQELDTTERLHFHFSSLRFLLTLSPFLCSSCALIFHVSHETILTIFLTTSSTLITLGLQFSCSVMSDSLRPHELQHTRPPCPSPTPGVHSNSWPSSQ